MKRWAGFGCVLAFLLLCGGAWLFLQPFTFTGGEALPYVDWKPPSGWTGTAPSTPLTPWRASRSCRRGVFPLRPDAAPVGGRLRLSI